MVVYVDRRLVVLDFVTNNEKKSNYINNHELNIIFIFSV